MSHVFWAIINALWQSAAVAAIVATGLRCIPRTTAAQRYALWCAVLAAAALLPIADLAMPSRTIAVPVNAPPPAPVLTRVVTQVSRVVAPPVSLRPASAPIPARNLPSPLLVLWFAVAAALLIRLGFAYAALRGVKSSLVPDDALTVRVQNFNGMGSRHAVVGVSPCVAEPCAIGFLHPAIALSTEMASTLPERDLERVLRHEYAHVRRYDDYANLLQRVLAALLWFNPVVHLAGRAMAIEREIACDDAAAAASAERVAFARCLYEIAQSAPRRRYTAAAGFIGTRRQIALRVARLVERNHNASTRLGSFAKITAMTVLAISLALAGVHVTALAVPQTPLPHVAAAPEPAVEKPFARVEIVEDQVKTTVERSVKSKVDKPLTTQIKIEKHIAFATSPPLVAASPAPAPTPMEEDEAIRAVQRLEREQLRAARRTPRGPDLMDALANAGFKNLSVDDLIMLAKRGVSPLLINQLHANGLTPMPAESLARLADSGVSGAYIGGLARLGYANLPIDDYIRLRNANVTLEFVQRLQRSGIINGRATVEQLIKLANSGMQ